MMRFPPITTMCILAILAGGLTGCASLRSFSTPPAPRPIEIGSPTDDQVALLQTAETASEAGNYDDALLLFQEILGKNPTITTAYLGMGDIYLLQKDYDKAEPAFARAARLEPRNFDAQYGHGLALQMLNRLVEAVKAYHRALTIQPENPEANLNLATTYLQMKQPDHAVVFAEKAVENDPASGAARANLGAIYEKLGRNAEAVDAYIAALELMGNKPQLMLNLISVLSKEKRYQEAANTAETLLRIEPSADVYERLGWCYFRLKVYFKSIEAYRSAVALDPEYWPAWNGVGVNALNDWLLSKRRNMDARDEARDAFRHSLRANSDQPKVVKLLLNYNLR